MGAFDAWAAPQSSPQPAPPSMGAGQLFSAWQPQNLPQLNQHQQNAFQTAFNLAGPQERQQLMKAYGQYLPNQGQDINQPAPQQGQYHDSAMTNVQNATLGVGNWLGNMASSVLPYQTAGENIQRNAQGQPVDKNGQPINLAAQPNVPMGQKGTQQLPSSAGGHAASTADVARTAVADRLMFSGGLPGLAKAGSEVPLAVDSMAPNLAQRALASGLQFAPQMGAGSFVNSFNNQGMPITPGQQFQKTLSETAQGLGSGLVLGAANPIIHAGLENGAGLLANGANRAADGFGNLADNFRSSPLMQGERGSVPLDPTGKPVEATAPLAALKQEALKYKSADEFVDNVHQQIENPASGKSFTNLAKEYNLPAEDVAKLNKIDELRWSQNGPKTYTEAANQLGLGDDYSRITNQISKEGTDRYVNPYGNSGVLGETFTRPKLTDLYNQAHAEATPTQAGTPTAAVPGSDIAHALGINPETAGQLSPSQIAMHEAAAEAGQNGIANHSDTVESAKNNALTQAYIDSQKNAPDPYQGLTMAKNAEEARQNAYSAENIPIRRANSLANLADRLFGKDASPQKQFWFGDSIEHPENLEANAEKLGVTPQQLTDFITQFREQAPDFFHSLMSGLGSPMGYLDRYALHNWDLSDSGARAAMEDMRTGQYTGGFDKSRVFPDLATGHAATYTDVNGETQNFQLKNQSIGNAIRDYGRQTGQAAKAASLIRDLQAVDPKGIEQWGAAGGSLPVDANGKPFKLSGIPGMENYVLSPKLYNETQGLRSLDMSGLGSGLSKFMQLSDKISRMGKQVELFGGGFHQIIEGMRFSGQELVSGLLGGDLRRLGNIPNVFSMLLDKGQFARMEDMFTTGGWNDLFSKIGLTDSTGADLRMLEGLKSGSFEKLNPVMEGLFKREIPMMKKLTVYSEALRMGLKDPGGATPEQLSQLRGKADAANARYGGLNNEVMNRNPAVQWLIRQGLLAPDFTFGKIATYKQAFDPRQISQINNLLPEGARVDINRAQGAGGLARTQIVGMVLLTAALSEVARFAVTGQTSQNATDVVNNDILHPNFPLPFKNAKGQNIVAQLPSTDISEIANAAKDPSHYASARLSFGASLIPQAMSGKDYYGNPLVDPFQNPNPNFGQNALGALKSRVPIPIGQANKVVGGSENLATAAVNTLGLRVSRDPNDPTYQASQQYYKDFKQATQGLDPNQLNTFNDVNPIKKDASGNYVVESKFNPYTDPAKTYNMLKDPAVLAAMQKLNVAQPNHDPMWDLPIDAPDGQPSLKTFLIHQGIQGTDYGIATAKTIVNGSPTSPANTWINDVNNARSQFFSTLPKSQNPDGQNPLQYPNIDYNTQQLINQFSSITDPKLKAAFAQANPQVTDAFNQLNNYTQAKRTQEGVPQFAQAPVPSAAVQAMMNAGNFKDPAVQAYLNANAAFKISGPFGNGIQGAGGNRNTPMSAINNVAAGLQANGKPSPYASKAGSSANKHLASMAKSMGRNTKYALKEMRYGQKKTARQVAFESHTGNNKPKHVPGFG